MMEGRNSRMDQYAMWLGYAVMTTGGTVIVIALSGLALRQIGVTGKIVGILTQHYQRKIDERHKTFGA